MSAAFTKKKKGIEVCHEKMRKPNPTSILPANIIQQVKRKSEKERDEKVQCNASRLTTDKMK